MKPIIGVTPHYEGNERVLGVRPGYFSVLRACGGLPLMLPLTDDARDIDQLLGLVNGILVTGGVDINPATYGEEPLPQVNPPFDDLDQFEISLIRRAIDRNLPVFGICRGMQAINVALGGTLYQDLPSQYHTGCPHFMEPPLERMSHRVTLLEGGYLKHLVGEETIGVNSRHHQAIRKLADGLARAAVSDDGIIEAIEMPKRRFVRAVQWHPELMWRHDDRQQRIIRHFVEACRQGSGSAT